MPPFWWLPVNSNDVVEVDRVPILGSAQTIVDRVVIELEQIGWIAVRSDGSILALGKEEGPGAEAPGPSSTYVRPTSSVGNLDSFAAAS